MRRRKYHLFAVEENRLPLTPVILFLIVSWAITGFPNTKRVVEVPSSDSNRSSPPNQIVVKFKAPIHRDKQRNSLRSVGEEVRFFSRPSVVRRDATRPAKEANGPSIFDQLAVVKTAAGLDLDSAIRRMQINPDVEYAEPNFRYRIAQANPKQSVPDDFDLDKAWGLRNTTETAGTNRADIHAVEAWSLATGDKRVTVAILDTGVDYFHPDLQPNIWTNPREIAGNGLDDDRNGYVDDVHGYDFVSGDSDPMDDNSHGTHVSGIIGAAGNNQRGIAGVCWEVGLMALKAFDETGNADVIQVVEAVRYAIENGAQIINASWGGFDRSRALEEIIAEAHQAGILVVAAAGNEKTDLPFYPAAYPHVLAVGATDPTDQRSPFSNYGAYVDVAAPGENIYSTIPNNQFGFISGTSMAAPYAAGLAALIKARYAQFANHEIENIIRNTSDSITPDKPLGTGRINAYRALLVNAPLPVAKLIVPTVLSGNGKVIGTAHGNNFAGCALEYGKGAHPTNWIRLHTSAQPLADEGLSFSTAALDDGTYSIRLVAHSTMGTPAIDRALVEVRNVNVSFPMNNDLLRAGETIEIRGTIFGPNRTFSIEFGLGWRPSVWLRDGITLRNGGRGEVLDSTLATWDTRLAQTNEFYSLKLTARVDGQVVGEQIVHMVFLDGRLKPGWPQDIPIIGEYPPENWRDIKVADLNRDGYEELLLVDHGNTDGKKARLLVYNHDGTLRWSKELAAGAPYADIPVVGDVDNDGFQEIFVDVGDQGELFAFTHDGGALPGAWPIRLEATNLGKVLADLDGDGFKELVAYAQNPIQRHGADWRRLMVVSRDGSVRRSWELLACARTIDAPKMFPAVGNLDSEADLEIVVVSGCNEIVAYKQNRPSAPLWIASTEGTLLSSPVIGDLDRDGRNEIVIGAYRYQGAFPGGLYVFNHDGQLSHGWPVLLDQSFSAAPALADFDQDGDLEISIPSSESQKLHLVHHHGFNVQGWPVGPIDNSYIKSSSVIGDVNTDGKPDVLLASPGYWFLTATSGNLSTVGGIKGWRFDGQPIDLNSKDALDSLVMEGSAGKSWLKAAPITLADIDANGKLDIVAASIQDRAYAPLGEPTARKNRSSIYVWELNVPYRSDRMPWPTFQGSPQHTGSYVAPLHINQPPVISSLPDQTIRPGTSFVAIELDQHIEDPDDEPEQISWTVIGATALKVAIDVNRVATFTPPSPSWTGREIVQFIATDSGGLSSSGTVTFEVRANYNPPIVRDDLFQTHEDTPIEFDPLANDETSGVNALSIAAVSRPRFGIVKQTTPGRLSYMPKPQFNGTDRFTYSASDAQGRSAIGIIRVGVRPVNDRPIAAPDSVITIEDTPLVINPLINDKDVDGDTFMLADFSQPAEGSVTAQPDGKLLYSPKPNFAGLEAFSYTIRDPDNTIGTNTVTVMVKPVNDPPIAKDQAFSLNKRSYVNLEFLAQDVEEEKLAFKVLKGPEHGVLLAFPTVAEYYPEKDFVGTDSFTYQAHDGHTNSAPATVTFNVVDANNRPAPGSQSLSAKAGQPLRIKLTAKDLDDDVLTFQIHTLPAHGSVISAGPNVTYQPQPGFLGSDEFRFQVSDGKSTNDAGLVSIQVTDLNTAPVAMDSFLITVVNTATNLVLQSADGEGDPLTFEIVADPLNGKLTGQAPHLTYTPNANYLGSDRFTFKVHDGELSSRIATTTITVKYPNHAPEPKEQSVTVPMNQPSPITLALSDLDGDRLQTVILKGPRNGRLAGMGTNFIYSPKPGFSGEDTFTYRAWDGQIYSGIGEATIWVSSPNNHASNLAIESINRLGNGQTRLIVKAPAGKTISVEASTNLVDWISLETINSDSAATPFTDANTTHWLRRFYRLRRLE